MQRGFTAAAHGVHIGSLEFPGNADRGVDGRMTADDRGWMNEKWGAEHGDAKGESKVLNRKIQMEVAQSITEDSS